MNTYKLIFRNVCKNIRDYLIYFLTLTLSVSLFYTDAVEQVLQHYRGYINKLCTGILYDKHGQPHVCIDEYMKRHLEIKLISSIVTKAETG